MSTALSTVRAKLYPYTKEVISLTIQLEIQPQIVIVPRELLPLVRLVRDMLWDLGYSPIHPEFLELLCRDLELLAVMQKIAFQIRGQEVNACQK